jgi:hypothetical protein
MVPQPLGGHAPHGNKQRIYRQDHREMRAAEKEEGNINADVISAVRKDQKSDAQHSKVLPSLLYVPASAGVNKVPDCDSDRKDP